MFKIVETDFEMKEFHRIKQECWNGEGYEMEYAKPFSDQILFFDNDGSVGGTFECTPFEKSGSYIHNLFQQVVKDGVKVVEVDSFAVLPKYRGKLGREIVSFMVFYAEWKGYTHGVGLADPSVFRSFNETYQIPSIQIAEERMYKGDIVIPTLFDFKTVYENKHEEKYAWFVNPIEMKEGVLSAKY